ncbi:hypothetical protein KC19_VG007100 [Ceratodon purpureus]|uniref:Uncharacterized protein n=1 Tax=Ceratodon purpureus TaxID=3225 RepID=A0A8T0HKQ5_CERPU|nr:hypothetical protein KC19_VG007100 [Ceratodon purpureus]
MASSMQAIGCSSSFANGWTLIGVRGSPSLCRRARNLSPRSSLSAQGEDKASSVDYEDVPAQWLSADFLDLRLRSSGLMCNEAIQALRNHIQKKDEKQAATAANITSIKQKSAAPSTSQTLKNRPLSNVMVLDDAFFPHMYNSNSSYTTKCSFLDESFC